MIPVYRPKIQAAAVSVLTLVLVTLVAAPSIAQVYKWEDEDGNIHFSDQPRHAGFKWLKDPTQEARKASVSAVRVRKRGVATAAWDGVISQSARRHRVDPALVKAVLHTESFFYQMAVSHKGAQGLMQLMPATAHSLGVDDPFNPWQNIEGGTKYLAYLMRRFDGNLELTLAAYNAGETTVRRYGGIPPYRETKKYVKRVMSLKRRYGADFR